MLDPVNFGTVLIDEVWAYNIFIHQLSIPISGYYYIHLNVEAQTYKQVNYKLVSNNLYPVAFVYRGASNHNAEDTLHGYCSAAAHW